jgi:hypothetical protein
MFLVHGKAGDGMSEEHKAKESPESAQQRAELSPILRELLGLEGAAEGQTLPLDEEKIPTLASDPWGSLTHEQGMEIVDLQRLRIQMSEKDVEQVLDVMKEQPPQPQS